MMDSQRRVISHIPLSVLMFKFTIQIGLSLLIVLWGFVIQPRRDMIEINVTPPIRQTSLNIVIKKSHQIDFQFSVVVHFGDGFLFIGWLMLFLWFRTINSQRKGPAASYNQRGNPISLGNFDCVAIKLLAGTKNLPQWQRCGLCSRFWRYLHIHQIPFFTRKFHSIQLAETNSACDSEYWGKNLLFNAKSIISISHNFGNGSVDTIIRLETKSSRISCRKLKVKYDRT